MTSIITFNLSLLTFVPGLFGRSSQNFKFKLKFESERFLVVYSLQMQHWYWKLYLLRWNHVETRIWKLPCLTQILCKTVEYIYWIENDRVFCVEVWITNLGLSRFFCNFAGFPRHFSHLKEIIQNGHYVKKVTSFLI